MICASSCLLQLSAGRGGLTSQKEAVSFALTSSGSTRWSPPSCMNERTANGAHKAGVSRATRCRYLLLELQGRPSQHKSCRRAFVLQSCLACKRRQQNLTRNWLSQLKRGDVVSNCTCKASREGPPNSEEKKKMSVFLRFYLARLCQKCISILPCVAALAAGKRCRACGRTRRSHPTTPPLLPKQATCCARMWNDFFFFNLRVFIKE